MNRNKTHFFLQSKSVFLSILLASFLCISSCQKNEEGAPINAAAISQSDARLVVDNQVDDRYKFDKKGQFVAKGVQVADPAPGQVRASRPKYDILTNSMKKNSEPEEPGCGGPSNPCPGDGSTATTFTQSTGLGSFSGNPAGYIYALRIIRGTNSSITPSTGHIKIASDLNKGAGGKYIYLTFSRNPLYARENAGDGLKTYTTPITNLQTVLYSQGCDFVAPYFCDTAPGSSFRHMYYYNQTYDESIETDLNDGAGGKFIYGHVTRSSTYGTPIKEIGILSGLSGSIQPPTGWTKYPQDLNENAGGYFIYFCYKK